MFGIQDISKRFGLPDKAVRRRLDALSTVLAPHTSRGANNAILLNDSGLAIFDRLVQLERENGQGLSAAARVVENEVLNGLDGEDKPSPNDVQTSEIEAMLKDQILELKRDKAYLQEQLEKALNQNGELQAYALPSSSEGRKSLTRLQHLRAVLFGE